MKLLGIDYGGKRIGLATGDTDTSLAFALYTIANDRDAIVNVLRAAKEEQTDKIVVGIPSRLSGAAEEGDTEREVRAFMAKLKEATNIPLDTEDERMTSAIAERLRRDAGMQKQKDYDTDAEAAAVMLESHLQRMAN